VPFIRNPHTFRIWCPDELVSNKLDATLRDSGRNFQWDVASRNQGGRVIEVLSEHMCQGMLQGYTLTGRTGLFPSYESFMGIIHTMVGILIFNRLSRCLSAATGSSVQQIRQEGRGSRPIYTSL
jgi:phosphoketolase